MLQVFLSTKDGQLDKLLSRSEDKTQSGLCVGLATNPTISQGRIEFDETSVVLIEGGAGAGKTVLALQLSSAVANARLKDAPLPWGVTFISLEQSPKSLLNVVENFEFDQPDNTFVDLTDQTESESADRTPLNKVLLSKQRK